MFNLIFPVFPELVNIVMEEKAVVNFVLWISK